mmetsp:Transcript_65762/g.174329  ORF Transcript_65762/g.174329 Transcript_65762/m.174329 type:complete len:200 (-) Transcript_65762:888-1487(-)
MDETKSCSGRLNRLEVSHDVGDEHGRDTFLVLVPTLAVLLLTEVIITDGPMNQQDRKIDRVEVCDDGPVGDHWASRGAAPSPSHEPIASVIDFPCQTPPPRNKELRCLPRLLVLHFQRLKVAHNWVLGVSAKPILLQVGRTKKRVTAKTQGGNCCEHARPNLRVVIDEVPRLQPVGERNPSKISKSKHITETICSNVHG